ncbi:MAG: hypothetical protein WCK29_03395 [archaeon]
MVKASKSKKVVKKETKKVKAVKKVEEKEEMSVDDAFADDEDVEYAKPKPKKEKKGKGMSAKELEEELDEAENEESKVSNAVNGASDSVEREITFKTSKPISKVKKGDKLKIEGIEYEVDGHYVLIDHGATKEMAIEIFNPKTDKDYQLRYFDDQVESTLDLYELQDILYLKRQFKKIEW